MARASRAKSVSAHARSPTAFAPTSTKRAPRTISRRSEQTINHHGWTRINTDSELGTELTRFQSVFIRVHPWFTKFISSHFTMAPFRTTVVGSYPRPDFTGDTLKKPTLTDAEVADLVRWAAR